MDGDPDLRLTCFAGCGEWWAKQVLVRRLSWTELQASEADVRSLLDQPFPPIACLLCGRLMTVSLRSGITFDHCDDHGIWLDRGERDKFVVAFAFEVDGGLAR
jgi:hypothetical protein